VTTLLTGYDGTLVEGTKEWIPSKEINIYRSQNDEK
jgi:hypothetical protein